MADWTAPFHRPHITTAEFRLQREEYIAKHGYTITIPGLSDIIHVGFENKITPQEEIDWKNKDWSKFTGERREEIKGMKQKRKEKYLAMLGSPTPDIFRNAGSILTSLDDCQDALTALSVVGRIAMKVAPRILGRAMLGPVGWILTAADIINLIMFIGRMATMPMMGKKTKEQATEHNPFSKKSKLKRAAKLARSFPSKGEAIEILQTTDQVFGVGVCLGPVVGFLSDVMFGGIQTGIGNPVVIKSGGCGVSEWTGAAMRMSKAYTHLLASGYSTDDDEMMEVIVAGYLAQQECLTAGRRWNPLDMIEDVHDVRVQAPMPKNILTLEVIEEEGIPLSEVVGWPHNHEEWAPIQDIVNLYDEPAGDALQKFMHRHEHDWMGFAGGNMMTEQHFHTVANLEGETGLGFSYTAQARWASMMLENGYYLDPRQPASKLGQVKDWIEQEEYEGWNHSFADYWRWYSYHEIKTSKIVSTPPP